MVDTITLDELRLAIDDGSVVVLEAQSPEQFEQEHISGARNLPLDALEALAPQLVSDKSQPIVTYCSNPNCKNSTLAAERLMALGYQNVRKFPGGKQEWAAAGLPLSHGA